MNTNYPANGVLVHPCFAGADTIKGFHKDVLEQCPQCWTHTPCIGLL